MSNLNSRQKRVPMPRDAPSVSESVRPLVPKDLTTATSGGSPKRSASTPCSVGHLLRMAELLNQASVGAGEMRRIDGNMKWLAFEPVKITLFEDCVSVHDPNESTIRLLRDAHSLVSELAQGYLPSCLENRYGSRGVPLAICGTHATAPYASVVEAPAVAKTSASYPSVRLMLPRHAACLFDGMVPPPSAECVLPHCHGRLRRQELRALADGGYVAVLTSFCTTYMGLSADAAPAKAQELRNEFEAHVMRSGAWCLVTRENPLADRDVVRCTRR